MCATFISIICTTIASYNSTTDANDVMDSTTFYDKVAFLRQHMTKHNALIINRDITAQIDKDGNHKFQLHNLPNRNGEYLSDFSHENSLSCWNPKSKQYEQRISGTQNSS